MAKIQFDWKKQLFWLIAGAVLVIALVVWSTMTGDTTKVRGQITGEATALQGYANKANTKDGLKNQTHVQAAREYAQRLESQKEELLKQAQQKVLDTKEFESAPQDNLGFDGWLGTQRQRLMEAAKGANLQLPPDFDKLTFSDSPTDDHAAEPRRHRNDRVRYMTILALVVNELTKKPGEVETRTWEPDTTKTEDIKKVLAGGLALEKFIVASPKESEERAKRLWDSALRNAGAGAPKAVASNAPPILEMPFSTTAVDVVFLAHQSAVPGLLQGLEKNPHYAAVITKVDFERAAPNFPSIMEKSLQNAGPSNPLINTYWLEGPVRVLVSMDLYQYDQSKADKLKAAAAGPAKAPPAAGTPAGRAAPIAPRANP